MNLCFSPLKPFIFNFLDLRHYNKFKYVFRQQSNGNDVGGGGHISFTDNEGNVITTDASLVGSHFLTTEDGEQVLTKIELDSSGDVRIGRF